MCIWLAMLLFVVVSIGHAVLWITAVNRIHAIPMRERWLKRFRHLHDVMMFLVPGLLLWRVFLTGPKLFRGGELSDVPSPWLGLMILSSLGCAGFCYAVLRWQLYRLPKRVLTHETTTVDLEQETEPMMSPDAGRYRGLLRVPMNELLRIEVGTTTLHMPDLPPDWEGLSILHLSDWHLSGVLTKGYFRIATEQARKLDAELIVFTGDLIDDDALIDWLPDLLGSLTAPLGCWFILGNHDRNHDHDRIREVLKRCGWNDLGGKTAVVHRSEGGGSPLLLAGDESPWLGTHPGIELSPDRPWTILLSHTPDHFPWAKRRGIPLTLAGHNHGGQVVLPVIGPVYSPSRFGVRYAGGIFDENDALLVVSRGLTGLYPLRFRCSPEITKLVLTTTPNRVPDGSGDRFDR